MNDNNKDDKSHFSASHSNGKQNILKIGIPVAAVAIVLGIVFGMQGSQQGTVGAKMEMHIHPLLSIKVNGQPIIVPVNVGIDKTLWKDHSLDKYGMQGMSPLHTHDNKGMIRLESSVNRDYVYSVVNKKK